jgi:chromosomal replication initiator protein
MAVIEDTGTPAVTVDSIVAAASRLSGFDTEALFGYGRQEPLVWWRMATMALCRIELGWSWATLGDAFGRDYSTVKHAAKRCRNDPELARCVARIRAELHEPATRGRGHLRVIDGGLGGDAA